MAPGMSAVDPLIDAYVTGLDVVPVQMAVTAAGLAIGRAPLTEVSQSNSVILYCKRHSNIERIIASVRFQFANVPMRVTLSELVSAVLKSAEALGVIILTETEVRIIASDAIERMETELGRLQAVGGLSAINRSVQNDGAAALVEVPAWHAVILSWLDGLEMLIEGSCMGCWHNRLAILCRVGVMSLSKTLAIIGPQLADTIWQLCDCASKWVKQGERLIVGLLRNLLAAMLR